MLMIFAMINWAKQDEYCYKKLHSMESTLRDGGTNFLLPWKKKTCAEEIELGKDVAKWAISWPAITKVYFGHKGIN